MRPAAALLLALCVPLEAQGQRLAPRYTYSIERPAPGILAFIAHSTSPGILSGNSVAILGKDAVLVVDSGQFPSYAKEMIATIRAATDKPVRYLVNTHWHGDHHYGNAVYQEAFPGLTIISTSYTQAKFTEMAPRYFGMAFFGPAVQQLQDALAADRSGKRPLSEAQRSSFTGLLGDFEVARPELEQFRLCPPELGYEQQLSLELGGRRVLVLFPGRGNTGGDSAVFVPDAKLLATGDLLVDPIPFAFGSFIGEWPAALRRLEALEPALVVPGHGPIEQGTARLALLREALEALHARVQAAFQKGLSLEETAKQVDLADFRERFCGGDKARERDFATYFLQPGLRRAYREAKEGPLKDED